MSSCIASACKRLAIVLESVMHDEEAVNVCGQCLRKGGLACIEIACAACGKRTVEIARGDRLYGCGLKVIPQLFSAIAVQSMWCCDAVMISAMCDGYSSECVARLNI